MQDLIVDFLNTEWYLTHKLNRELFADKNFLHQFFESKGFIVKKLPDEETVSKLLTLRSFLSNVLKIFIKEKKISPQNIEKLNEYLNNVSYKKIIAKNGRNFELVTAPKTCDWNWIMSEIIATFMDLINHDDKDRIKCCENPECGIFFFDETKNRTKRWCDNTCASLMKVRRFRAKQKLRSAKK